MSAPKIHTWDEMMYLREQMSAGMMEPQSSDHLRLLELEAWYRHRGCTHPQCQCGERKDCPGNECPLCAHPEWTQKFNQEFFNRLCETHKSEMEMIAPGRFKRDA